MRLLVATEYFPPAIFGGGELSAYHLAKALVRQGHDVSVLTSKVSGEKTEEIKDSVRVLRRVSTGRTPTGLLHNLARMMLFPKSMKEETMRLVQEGEKSGKAFDAVHCMNMTSMVVAELKNELASHGLPLTAHINSPLPICPKGDRMRYGKQCTVDCNVRYFTPCLLCSKYVGKVKNRWYFRFNPLFYAMIYLRYARLKKTLQKFDGLVAISDFMRRDFAHFVRRKIVVIPNIIPLSAFGKGERKAGKKVRILYYGGLLESKGLSVLLDALRQLSKDRHAHGYTCDAYGDGPLAHDLASSGLVTVHMPVLYERLPAILAEHDIVVLPSIWPEPFGRVVIETMAAGLPIVASRIGGIPELVNDGKTGYLVQPNDAVALAKAIKRLMDAPGLRRQMGEAAKAASKAYSEEKIAKAFIQELKGMVA